MTHKWNCVLSGDRAQADFCNVSRVFRDEGPMTRTYRGMRK